MFDRYLTFRSLTAAQRAHRALRRVGIPSRLERAPEGMSSLGCGYVLRLRERELIRAAELLRRQGIAFERLMLRGSSGSWEARML